MPSLDRRSALFLDADGTLLDIAETPRAVTVPSGLPDTLGDLLGLLDGAMALVSGRSIAELDRLFGPLQPACAGLHGLELRLRPGASVMRMASAAIGNALRNEIAAIALRNADLLVEDKGASITLHYRRAPTLAVPLARQLRAAIAGSGLSLTAGRMVWEIRDATCSKATAIRALMRQPAFAGRRPIYIGDDYGDEDGFAEAERLGGVALAVASESTIDRAAAFADPAAVRAWLRAAAESLRGTA